jgi:hypothetical protein
MVNEFILITIWGNLWKNGNGGVVLQCEEQRAKSKEWDGAIVLPAGRQVLDPYRVNH